MTTSFSALHSGLAFLTTAPHLPSARSRSLISQYLRTAVQPNSTPLPSRSSSAVRVLGERFGVGVGGASPAAPAAVPAAPVALPGGAEGADAFSGQPVCSTVIASCRSRSPGGLMA